MDLLMLIGSLSFMSCSSRLLTQLVFGAGWSSFCWLKVALTPSPNHSKQRTYLTKVAEEALADSEAREASVSVSADGKS